MLMLHDTASGRKKHFFPQHDDGVRMYVCGPTVYDVPHLGNARPAVVFDVLFRLLRARYGADAVVYARNYTDIDDKIITRAAERGISIDELTETTIAEYERLTLALNVLEPTIKPRATQSLDSINKMIERLVTLCVAYISEGHVLFSVSAAQNSTNLIDPNVELLQGHRVAVASYKSDPRDFVLWKPSKDGEPRYRGPFGLQGRPGWHIECSAMICEHLGETIDIHAGGNDLIFPHHMCEVLQSETMTGEPLSRYWLHNGMLTVNGRKMAKSADNFITVPQALERVPGEALRYLLLSGHYRQPLDFTWLKLAECKVALDRIYRALAEVWDAEPRIVADENPVHAALKDDLNTPDALAALHGLADHAFKKDRDPSTVRALLLEAGQFLGLLSLSPAEWLRGEADANEVERLIVMREASRRAKDFSQADEIRNELREMGVTVEDTAAGPIWHTF